MISDLSSLNPWFAEGPHPLKEIRSSSISKRELDRCAEWGRMLIGWKWPWGTTIVERRSSGARTTRGL